MYEKYADNYNSIERIKFHKSAYWARQVFHINNILKRMPLSVLDIGCRTGDFLMHFPHDINREGVELSYNSAEVARKRGIKVYRDFIENIQFDKQYDVVTAYAVLEHLIDPIRSIEKISNIVSNTGLLVIMIPTYQCIKTMSIDIFTHRRWHMYCPPMHLNFFSRIYIDECFNKYHFKLVKRYYTSGGIFNPFTGIKIIGIMFSKIISVIDEYSILNKFPIFDHMYSFYIKK